MTRIPLLSGPAWFTNDPEAAKALRAADKTYDKARANAAGLSLTDKVAVYRAARMDRESAYARVMESAQ